MFISHDLSTVRAICDEMMVLYAGQMMEFGSRNALRQRPFHPYADLLIASVPELRQGWLEGMKETLLKEAAVAGGVQRGDACSFFGRCAVRIGNRCEREMTPLRRLSKGTGIRCQRTEAELLAAQSEQP